jgi:serine/threonine-protein kinase HipA
MNCLCCGKPLLLTQAQEKQWHISCIKKFFGTSSLPVLNITGSQLAEFAAQSVRAGLSVPGVQRKMSLHLNKKDDISRTPRLTLVGYPAGYILKPDSSEYPQLPASEYLVMQLASLWKIATVPFALIRLADENFAYITKRIDRNTVSGSTHNIPMEDFCQLSLRLTEDKYKGSYEQCGKIIDTYSTMPLLDKTEFFNRLLFCFVTGNSDMHLKNFSLIHRPGRPWQLSEAYDLLPVQIVNPSDTEETALTLNGKKKKITKDDFLACAANMGITGKVAENLIKLTIQAAAEAVPFIQNSMLSDDLKEKMKSFVAERMQILEKSETVPRG